MADLLPYAKNARTHSADQVAQLARSIEQFGFTNPVLVDEDGTIIAGHGRVLAAKRLKLDTVPVMVASGWTDAQRRAYVIADNQLALNAGWDEDVLKDELRALGEMGFDLALTGFDDVRLASFLVSGEGLTDPDEVPDAPAVPTTRLGDVWVLGDHRVMCGDSVDRADVDTLLSGTVPDLANCDPPYGISVVKGGSIGGAKPFGRVHGPARNAIIAPGTYAPIIGDETTDTAVQSHRLLVDIGVPAIVLWGGNYFADALPPSRCWLVWDKENTGTFADCELAWTNVDKVVKLFRHQWSGLIKASERGERRVHPTQKPVALAAWVAETVAPEATSVLDLFVGSGSTLIATEQRGQSYFGMELSPAYVDVSIRRWEAFTGREAILDGTTSTFAEIARQRATSEAA